MDYYDPRRRALRAVRQLLYPRECPFCGRVLGDVRDCPDCAEQLEALRRKPGIRLDPAQHYISNLAGAAAPYRYSGCVRRGILSTKYQGKPWRAVEMGNRLVQLAFGGELTVQYGELLPQPVPWAAIGYDLIVPVPASGKRRGYNVPERMAQPLAYALGLPLLPKALCRVRAGRHQAGLSLDERLANAAGAFRAQEPELVEGKRVLLVDDVITTGATAAACAQALLDAGAHSVFAVAMAVTENEMDAPSRASGR